MDGPVLSAPNICYELAEKTKAIAHGGIGAIHRLVQRVGLATRIDTDVRVLKVHQPYYESDHVLNIAYNLLCGGQTLDDIELRRTARVFLDALGTDSLPDPTTAGDFCRRFDEEQIEALMDAINETRLEVWQRCPGLVEETARIDGDGTLVPTTGACKEGMDIAYNGVWGYGPLLVSLANTGEPLFIKNRSANRPSHESAIPYFDKAVALCRRAGFTDVLLRGDTDFALTTAFDRWTTAGVRFVFGYDATATMVRWGQSAPPDLYEALVRRTERTLATAPRQRPANVKDRIVTDRGFKKITTVSEALVDFDYQPTTCTRPYRVVALKKNLSVERGEQVLFDDIRYFFYITNDRALSCHEVVHEGPAALRPREPDRAAEGRRPGAPRAGEHVARQLGLYGDGGPGLEPQGLGRAGASHRPPLAVPPRGGAATAAANGLPHLPRRVHQCALPNRHERATRDLPAARLEPVAIPLSPLR